MQWPPLIEVGDTWELPSVLIDRYNTAGGEGTALCGIFPEIRRAWASVDNSLFLWRFDKRDGQCPEYSGEEQAICAVGLAKCRPGVFVEAIQYLLVLATPVELVLVGVCCIEGPDGRDPYAEISVQPLPDYTISSDGVAMTCVACTNKGRIFMAGRDGHIYELLYTTGSGSLLVADGQCPEYSGEEQAICAVGLAKCRPGVFVEAIQYLLVLATPVELVLVGVCCIEGPDGRDPYAEISVQPLPDYTISSDGVAMTCVACTNKGRIFMAGRDGHIYELLYTTGSGWHKRCRKVCLTAGVGSMISRWVVPNVFKFGAVDPVVEMVIDNERQILYARTEEMKLQAYVFGPNGEGPLKMVAEERNLLNQKDVSQGNRQSAAAGRANKPTIVSISPLSMLESKWLHLVASLSDGRRMYLSTSSSGSSFSGFNNHRQAPNCLKVVSTRPSPPLGAGVGLGFGAASLAGRTPNEDLSMKVDTAFYSVGTLVLSDSSPPAMSSLLVVSKDSSVHSQVGGTSGSSSRSSRALREVVSSLPIEGRMLFVADVLPSPDTAATIQSLYSELEYCGLEVSGESYEKACGKLWARGDLSTQHILPRRKIVVFTTMGMMELIFNRPVDILRRLLESNSPRSLLEDFFTRFGAGEAAAMCLMLAARIINFEDLISNIVADKAAEAFEDPRMVGMPQFDGSSGLSNTRTATGGFSMGQVVQEAEPIFSGAHEGLCLCTSRLLFPIWELSVMSKKPSSDSMSGDGLVVCRLSTSAMHMLESKIRSLEKFLRSRRNQRRGLYGYVAGLGGVTGSILYGTGTELGASERNMVRSLFGAYSNGGESANKRQRLPYSPAELAATEVRAMECIRQLLLRSAEALFLLQLLSQHHVARLVQGLDANLKQALVQLTFHQLVCSEEGDQIATRLISALMEYYTGSDGRGTVDDISGRLREGCPSYFKESDYKFFLAVERLERAALAVDAEEKESVAREAFSFLSKVPGSADLRTVCKRFEELRFYEAVVCLPLQKAQALDPDGDAFNDQIDASIREHALAQRKQCYEIIANALRSLASSMLDEASRRQYICQIVHLGVQSTDKAFREYLYTAMIELGLENELLEYGGPDLVPFLQNAGSPSASEVGAVSGSSPLGHSGTQISSNQAKYFDLLAKYYVSKRQHVLAAHERSERNELVGDEDIARALLAACKGAAEPVLNAYDRLLSNVAIVPSPNLRIRLLGSVLVVLLEWAMSVLSDRMGSSPARSSLILGGSFAHENKAVVNQGVRDKIASAANRQVSLAFILSRYMTEVRRLTLPPTMTEGVYAGFKKLDESLLSPFSF
ncbi:hypothetical protein F2Q69_00026727 [Brassica cretica]|uniref:Nucleoporin Nup133/Nup155-like N-terminal domain-containing protein n=1 Tax=Brassica cretica TaxID=69181 RepID=A0A8S9S6D1_BRACR|nr:hypothetical protein F2Q69_00026727 [Brassica cretica]